MLSTKEKGKVHSTMKTNMWRHVLYKLLNNVVFGVSFSGKKC